MVNLEYHILGKRGRSELGIEDSFAVDDMYLYWRFHDARNDTSTYWRKPLDPRVDVEFLPAENKLPVCIGGWSFNWDIYDTM